MRAALTVRRRRSRLVAWRPSAATGCAMNILLLSMPDASEHMPPVAIRMPNGALASLAGNVDPHHRVAVADLILVQSSVRATVEWLVREWQPALVACSPQAWSAGV